MGNSVIAPAVVMRPILSGPFSEPQRAVRPSRDPSGPETGYPVIAPEVVMRPIWPIRSQGGWRAHSYLVGDHSAPAGPAVMSIGELSGVGIGYSVMPVAATPAAPLSRLIAPIARQSASGNQLLRPRAIVSSPHNRTFVAKVSFSRKVVKRLLATDGMAAGQQSPAASRWPDAPMFYLIISRPGRWTGCASVGRSRA